MFVCVCPRYVSIKPDDRKLANGTDVLSLLIDTLLMEGFHLVTPRTLSSEEKKWIYGFERMKRPEVLAMNKTVNLEALSCQNNLRKRNEVFLFSFRIKGSWHFLVWRFHVEGTYVSQVCTQTKFLALSPTMPSVGNHASTLPNPL